MGTTEEGNHRLEDDFSSIRAGTEEMRFKGWKVTSHAVIASGEEGNCFSIKERQESIYLLSRHVCRSSCAGHGRFLDFFATRYPEQYSEYDAEHRGKENLKIRRQEKSDCVGRDPE